MSSKMFYKLPVGSVDITGEASEDTATVSYSLGSLDFDLAGVPVNQLPLPVTQGLEIGWLPAMVRYLSPDRRVIVYERPPEVKDLNYISLSQAAIVSNRTSMGSLRSNTQHFKILIPWQVYVIGLTTDYTPSTMYVFARPEPLSNLHSALYNMPLLNLFGNGKVCTPKMTEMQDHNGSSVSEGIQTAYNMFWSSGFNYDLLTAVNVGQESSYVQWTPRQDGDEEDIDEIGSFYQAWSRNVHHVNDINFCPPSDGDTDTSPACDENGDYVEYILSSAINAVVSENGSQSAGNTPMEFLNSLISQATVLGTSS